MLINTGARTDIPAFFTPWFLNRLREGFVCVRNPYYPDQITRYRLTPDVVDALLFCTKNPRPILAHLGALDSFASYWFVTITAYGRDIEPHVPRAREVIQDFKLLSARYGAERLCWRYDPIFLYGPYTYDWHLWAFEKMAKTLAGHTQSCVISFITLYEKTKRNFAGIAKLDSDHKQALATALCAIANRHGMTVKTCAETDDLRSCGIDQSGCLSKAVLEKAVGQRLDSCSDKPNRADCACHPSRDIGAYNSCLHGCIYCYANDDQIRVKQNWALHDPHSPLLIGQIQASDVVRDAEQQSDISRQPWLF